MTGSQVLSGENMLISLNSKQMICFGDDLPQCIFYLRVVVFMALFCEICEKQIYVKIVPEIPVNQRKGLPKLLPCSRVAPSINIMEALMKATSYELKRRAFGSDHCDRATTVTSVTVVPERRKNPEMTTNTGFEHCDTKKCRITVTVVPFSPSTVTDVKVIRNQGNMPQKEISNGFKHFDTKKSSFNVAVVPKLAYVPRRLRMSNRKAEELRILPHKQETPVESKHSAFIDFTPREKLPLKHDREARLIGHFCTLVMRRLAVCGSKVDEWQRIVEEYNS